MLPFSSVLPRPHFFRYPLAALALLLASCASPPDAAANRTPSTLTEQAPQETRTENNEAQAQYHEARRLIRQPGPKDDPGSALALMEKSANQGYVKAQTFLGQMYLTAVGMSAPDLEKAFYWYKKAAENGGQHERMDYAMLLSTQRENPAAVKEGVERLEALADEKYPPALFMLSSYYEDGTGREKNTAKALSLMTEAATAGEPMAQYMLGLYYLTGKNVKKDRNTAIMWFQQSAKNGSPLAIEELREMGIPSPSKEPEK